MVTGMRRAEVVALRRTDVDLDGGMLTIRRNYVRTSKRGIEKVTKTHQMRRIALDAAPVTVLTEHRERYEQQARALASRRPPTPSCSRTTRCTRRPRTRAV